MKAFREIVQRCAELIGVKTGCRLVALIALLVPGVLSLYTNQLGAQSIGDCVDANWTVLTTDPPRHFIIPPSYCKLPDAQNCANPPCDTTIGAPCGANCTFWAPMDPKKVGTCNINETQGCTRCTEGGNFPNLWIVCGSGMTYTDNMCANQCRPNCGVLKAIAVSNPDKECIN